MLTAVINFHCPANTSDVALCRYSRHRIGRQRFLSFASGRRSARTSRAVAARELCRCSFDDWTPADGTIAPYQGSPEEVVSAALALSGLQAGEKLVDLGAGDGRVLVAAVADCGAGEAVGWEIDPELCDIAAGNIASRLRSQAHRARVVCGDARTADVAGAHVVLLYMLPEANAVLAREVLEPQLPSGCGTRVVAHTFAVPGWTPTDVKVVDGVTLYLYRR